LLALCSGRFVFAPKTKVKRYFQQATRFSSALALFSDVSMLVLGGKLKRKESLSARLGDILSHLYLLSSVLKIYYDQGRCKEDLPLVRFASEHCLFEIQERFSELLQNFPNRWMAFTLRWLIFPYGRRFAKAKDKYNHKIASLILSPTATRDRLSHGAFLTDVPENNLAAVQDALVKAIAAEPIEKILKEAVHKNEISGYTPMENAQLALEKNIISQEQYDVYVEASAACGKVIAVDDFSPDELSSQTNSTNTHKPNLAIL